MNAIEMKHIERQAASFERKSDRTGGSDACHPWKASCGRHGYGQIWFQGSMKLAHRVAFFLHHGRWPEPECCHRCDNPKCVNVAHLFEGTHKANMEDMARKNRHGSILNPESVPSGERHWSRAKPSLVVRGERNGMSKLTDQKVRDIRANRALCRVTHQELANRFGVSRSLIGLILSGKIWQQPPAQSMQQPPGMPG